MLDPGTSLEHEVQQLLHLLVAEQTLEDALQQVANMAARALSGDMAGITLLRNGAPTTVAYSDSAAPEVDAEQYRTGVGPCMDAYRNNLMYRIIDTELDERWPLFSEVALRHGVHSTLSMPLSAAGEGIGSINVYACAVDAFDEDDEQMVTMLAAPASVVVSNARAYWEASNLAKQLDEALASRAVIEQAKGMLMIQQGCSPEEAFDLLRRASQRSNRKLHTIATEIVEAAQRRRRPQAAPA